MTRTARIRGSILPRAQDLGFERITTPKKQDRKDQNTKQEIKYKI